jgi:hypothetical protein
MAIAKVFGVSKLDRRPVVALVTDAIHPYYCGGKESRYHELIPVANCLRVHPLVAYGACQGDLSGGSAGLARILPEGDPVGKHVAASSISGLGDWRSDQTRRRAECCTCKHEPPTASRADQVQSQPAKFVY